MKSKEALMLCAILATMVGMALLLWVLWNNLSMVPFTAAAGTRPARETRQAQTATAAAQATLAARQTRRARRTPTVNVVQSIATQSADSTIPPPTSTRDPRTPTPDLGTPEPTGTQPVYTPPPPWPTDTPLPPPPQEKRDGFWMENLSFGEAAPFGEKLNDISSEPDWSPDGKYLAISQWDGDWVLDEKGNRAFEVSWITLVSPDGTIVKRLGQGFMPKWSPDSKWIAYVAYEDKMPPLHVRVVNVETLQITEISAEYGHGPFPLPAWLSEHEIFYNDDQPHVFDTVDSTTKSFFDETQQTQFSSDSPLRYLTARSALGRVALASADDIYVFQRKDKLELIRHISEGIGGDGFWTMSSDGAWLVYTSTRNGEINIVSIADDKNRIVAPRDGRGEPRFQSWSPDENSFLYRDAFGIYGINRDGTGRRLISEIPGEPYPHAAGWSPQGDQIIVNNQEGEFMVVPVKVK